MRIAETHFKNFRNLKPRRLVWRSGLQLLCGVNGSGKTNILEALSLICGWGNFGGAKTEELINWNGAENALLFAEIEGEENFQVEISLSSRTSLKVSKERQSRSELRTRLPSLCFLPNDMNLIGGNPSVRRAFLDRLCALLSAPYSRRLSDYRRLVRHRIKLLRTGRNPDITSPLISSIGSWIWSVRKSVVVQLSQNIFCECSHIPLDLRLKGGGLNEINEIPDGKDEFLEHLNANSAREKIIKIPLIGPHRDDILITCDGKNAAQILSRGQKRRATVEFIIASGRVIEKKLRRSPVFFIDEISSELDGAGRETVANALFNTGWQIFATSAENNFGSAWRGEIFEVKEGEIYDNV